MKAGSLIAIALILASCAEPRGVGFEVGRQLAAQVVRPRRNAAVGNPSRRPPCL